MPFDAFVSYSHAADGKLAPALQEGLQRLGKGVFERRALTVFRDETGLSTNPHLWNSIETALDESEWFVLLASPNAAASQWVEREVETWLERKNVDRILLVVTEGDFAFDADGKLDATTSCVPAPLARALAAEPRWLDLRWARDESQLDLRNGRFRNAVADLAAPIHGVAKEDLESEDLRQQRRARRLAVVGVTLVAALAVASAIAAVVAFRQSDRADAATTRAVARSLAAQSASVSDTDIDLSLLLAVEGFRRDDSIETRSSLLDALDAGRRVDRFIDTLPRDVVDLALSHDRSTLWVVRADGTIQAYDPKTLTAQGKPLVKESSPPWSMALARDGSRLAFSNAGGVQVIDVTTGNPIVRYPYPNTSLEFDRTASKVLIGSVSPPKLILADIPTRRILGTLELARETNAQWPSGTFLANGNVLATVDGLTLRRYDGALHPLGGGTKLPEKISIWSLDSSPDGSRIAVGEQFDHIALLDAKTLEGLGPPVKPRGSRITHMSFTPDGRQVVVSGDDGSVTVLAASDSSEVASFAGLTGDTQSVILDGSSILSVSLTDGQAVRWKLGVQAGPGTVRQGGGEIGAISTAYGPGTEVWSAGNGHVSLRSGQRTVSGSLGKNTRVGSGLAVSRTQHTVAVTGGPIGHSIFGGTFVSIVDLDKMEPIRRIPMTKKYGEAISLALSPDGQRLAVGTTAGYLLVVDPTTGNTILKPRLVDSLRWVLPMLVWTPDARRVYVGGQNGVLHGFDTRTWKLVSNTALTPGVALTGGGMASDGTYLVVPSESGQVFKIDSTTGKRIEAPFAVRGTQLQHAAVSQDGSLVAALGRDGKLQLWDSVSHRPLGHAVSSHAGFSSALAPLGARGFVTGGIQEPGIVDWDFDPSSWVVDACRRVHRNLTAAEWQTQIGAGRYRATCASPTLSQP